MHRRLYNLDLQLQDTDEAGGDVSLNCALQGIRPERLWFASDYRQDFTGSTPIPARGMSELKHR
jgi:hypothetical protein